MSGASIGTSYTPPPVIPPSTQVAQLPKAEAKSNKWNEFIGFDATVNGKVTAVQVQFGTSDGKPAVKFVNEKGKWQVVDIDRYVSGQRNRYVNADGHYNKGPIRELLQQLVNNKVIKLGEGNARSNKPTFLPSIDIGEGGGFGGKTVVPNKSGGPVASKEVRDFDEAQIKANWGTIETIGKMIEVGIIVDSGGAYMAARQTFKTLTAERVAGAVLDQAKNQALKKAEATLLSFGVGAVAGGASYGLFIKDKYVYEAYEAMAAGKPLEALSYGAKAAVVLLNWTLVAGKFSGDIANANVQVVKKLMEGTLAKGQLKGFNWGGFIDPKGWTAKNITSAMGEAKGQEILTKYAPVFAEFERKTAAGQPLVEASGKLRVSDAAIRAAGFDSLESLVKSMSADGLWRAFTVKPLLGSPFVWATANGPKGTINSALQLAVSRGLGGGGANVVLQTTGGLYNGSVNINWDQASASVFGGGIRSSGAPGAWAASTMGKRIASYTVSSTAAFFGQWWLKGILQARNKTVETFTPKQLTIIGNANQAANAVARLLLSYGSEPPKELFNLGKDRGIGAAYLERLKGVILAGDEKQMTTLAKELDTWLDTPIATDLTRRQRLDQVSMPSQLSAEVKQFAGGKYNTGTMADLGIAPRFTPAAK